MSDKKDISYALDMFGGKVGHYIISATGIIVALSWNSTMKDIIKANFPQPQAEIKRNIIYSVMITLFLILLIWILPTPSSVKLKYETKEEQSEHMIGISNKQQKLNEYCV